MGMIYGLYDTEDNVWLGDEKGPYLFDTKNDPAAPMGIAVPFKKVRAHMADAQLGWPVGRTEAREWLPREVRHRDSVDVKRDALEAVEMLEEGKL